MLHSKLPPAASLLLPPLVDSPTLADILQFIGGAKLQLPKNTQSPTLLENDRKY